MNSSPYKGVVFKINQADGVCRDITTGTETCTSNPQIYGLTSSSLISPYTTYFQLDILGEFEIKMMAEDYNDWPDESATDEGSLCKDE